MEEPPYTEIKNGGAMEGYQPYTLYKKRPRTVGKISLLKKIKEAFIQILYKTINCWTLKLSELHFFTYVHCWMLKKIYKFF